MNAQTVYELSKVQAESGDIIRARVQPSRSAAAFRRSSERSVSRQVRFRAFMTHKLPRIEQTRLDIFRLKPSIA